MSAIKVVGEALLFTKGALRRSGACERGVSVLGYNNKRDLVWEPIARVTELPDQPAFHLWTTSGDCRVVGTTKLATALGACAADSLMERLQQNKDPKIEVPRLRIIEGLLQAKVEGTALWSILRDRVLPFGFADKSVLRIPPEGEQAVSTMLAKHGVGITAAQKGSFWHWLVISANKNGSEEHTFPLSEATCRLADALTRREGEGAVGWVTTTSEAALRRMGEVSRHLDGEAFSFSVSPRVRPLEVKMERSASWHPYTELIAVVPLRGRAVMLEFDAPSFCPLVDGFMLLPG